MLTSLLLLFQLNTYADENSLVNGAESTDDFSEALFEEQTQETFDPLEPVNRKISGFNRFFREAALDPLIDTYQAVTPDPVERSVRNFLSNLGEPVTIVSSLAQGDTDNAGRSMKRFAINSTIGLGGLRDKATEKGYERRKEDLGQALGAHGVGTGPHIVLPFFGPTNMRDAVSTVVQTAVNPVPLTDGVVDRTVRYSEARTSIQNLVDNSIDPYISEREAFEQSRQFAIANGHTGDSSETLQ